MGCNGVLANRVLIETFPSCSGIESRSGCGSKLGDETRLMTMKGGTVLDTVKMLACMLGGVVNTEIALLHNLLVVAGRYLEDLNPQSTLRNLDVKGNCCHQNQLLKTIPKGSSISCN